MWLCRCVGRVYGTTCWTKIQKARQRSRQVGAERWTSLEHEHLVKLTFFPVRVLAADVWEVLCRRRLVNCQRRRCLAGARSGFRQGCERHRIECQRGGNSGRGGRGRDSTVVTRPKLVLCVCCSRHFGCFSGLRSGVAHASDHGGGDCASDFSCSSVRVCPLEGIGSCVLANAGTPHRRH